MFQDVLGFDFLDPPDPFLLVQALKQLFYLEALDEEGKITELGRKVLHKHEVLIYVDELFPTRACVFQDGVSVYSSPMFGGGCYSHCNAFY